MMICMSAACVLFVYVRLISTVSHYRDWCVYQTRNSFSLSLSQILKPADKKLYPYGGGGGMGSGRPVTPPRNSAKAAKAKK